MIKHILIGFAFLITKSYASKDYCQPGNNECWPTTEEIESFKSSLSEVNECLPNFPTFTSEDEPGEMTSNIWYEKLPALMYPQQLLNVRQHIKDNLAYFVVLARNEKDVSEAVKFAKAHNLALSVFGTGHEFQDRNGGVSANGLLIRTLCLRKVDIDLSPENRFKHSDGVISLGSGMTWGTSKYKMKGVHEIAMENNRVVISGHAAEVGIVGWSMGGGHSPLGPLHGLGVDQMLEVQLVGADGSYITANNQTTSVLSSDGTKIEVIENNDLFWACRGGGAGPWGVVTAMTIKLHKPRDGCTKECYIVNNVVWASNYFADQFALASEILPEILKWCATASKYWSGYIALMPYEESGDYLIVLGEFMYVGKENEDEYIDAKNYFGQLKPEEIVSADSSKYDTYFAKTQIQVQEPVNVDGTYPIWTSVLLNKTVLIDQGKEITESLLKNFIVPCLGGDRNPCLSSYQMHLTWPRDDDEVVGTAIPKKTREANLHITTSPAFNVAGDLTSEEAEDYIHNVVSRELFQYGDASYYSESEYSMENGQWQNRLWDAETYANLLRIKNSWDPEHVFHCRHCVGDGEKAKEVSRETLPSWRLS